MTNAFSLDGRQAFSRYAVRATLEKKERCDDLYLESWRYQYMAQVLAGKAAECFFAMRWREG